MAEVAIQLSSLSDASLFAYARYLGALAADESKWAAVQLSALHLFINKREALNRELVGITREALAGVSPPTDEEIDTIRAFLQQNGLPEMEVTVLKRFGFSDKDIEDLTQVFLTGDNAAFRRFVELPELHEVIADGLELYQKRFPAPPEGFMPAAILFQSGKFELDEEIGDGTLKAYIELQEGHNPEQVILSSILLNGTVPSVTNSVHLNDRDKDGIPELRVEFNRDQVRPLLTPGAQALAITGEMVGDMQWAGVGLLEVK